MSDRAHKPCFWIHLQSTQTHNSKQLAAVLAWFRCFWIDIYFPSVFFSVVLPAFHRIVLESSVHALFARFVFVSFETWCERSRAFCITLHFVSSSLDTWFTYSLTPPHRCCWHWYLRLFYRFFRMLCAGATQLTPAVDIQQWHRTYTNTIRCRIFFEQTFYTHRVGVQC